MGVREAPRRPQPIPLASTRTPKLSKTATRFSKTTSIPSTSRPTTIPRMDVASGTRSTEEAAADTARVNADAEALENSDALLENDVHPVDISSDNDTEDADDDTDDDGIPRIDDAVDKPRIAAFDLTTEILIYNNYI